MDLRNAADRQRGYLDEGEEAEVLRIKDMDLGLVALPNIRLVLPNIRLVLECVPLHRP
jgi:hypothetical protein